ncbi:MAG: hypothetical protein ABFD08_18705 [Syntrophomonas sp.]
MYKDLESRWKGTINKSSLQIAKKLIESNEKQQNKSNIGYYAVAASIVLGAIFFYYNGLDIRNWFDSSTDLGLLLLITVGVGFSLRNINAEKKNSDDCTKFKDLLIKRIDSNFCACTALCKHKEEFMDYMNEIHKINLYY